MDALPEGGYFIDGGLLNFDKFLMLVKEIYYHMREKEVDNYNKLLETRKESVKKNAEVKVEDDYAGMIIKAMKDDRRQRQKSMAIAAHNLNDHQDKHKFKGQDVETFLRMAQERDADFAQIHGLLKHSIESSDPKTKI